MERVCQVLQKRRKDRNRKRGLRLPKKLTERSKKSSRDSKSKCKINRVKLTSIWTLTQCQTADSSMTSS